MGTEEWPSKAVNATQLVPCLHMSLRSQFDICSQSLLRTMASTRPLVNIKRLFKQQLSPRYRHNDGSSLIPLEPTGSFNSE